MLVLTRKPEQRLMLGDDIVIKVIEVRGNQVKLGITAPASCPVHREEVYMRLRNEGQKHIKAGGTE